MQTLTLTEKANYMDSGAYSVYIQTDSRETKYLMQERL